MSVAENIARMRESKNMTQQELAEAVGVSQSMIGQIERGSKIPTVILANVIAKALDADICDIVGGVRE